MGSEQEGTALPTCFLSLWEGQAFLQLAFISQVVWCVGKQRCSGSEGTRGQYIRELAFSGCASGTRLCSCLTVRSHVLPGACIGVEVQSPCSRQGLCLGAWPLCVRPWICADTEATARAWQAWQAWLGLPLHVLRNFGLLDLISVQFSHDEFPSPQNHDQI